VNKKELEFQEFILDWYEKCGRHDLPWRQSYDPYRILVSELMLQQTQVQRVIPKYDAFITRYPTIKKLAKASLGDVLCLWQRLGYNRRAKFLLQCAQTVVHEHGGVFPTEYDVLIRLPGIGPYTASAICAFAYNQPVELIETNVRQVYIHHFFKMRDEVTDKEILILVQKTLPPAQARDWYAAVMDYGTNLKSLYGNNTRKVKGYKKQTKFKGSNREVRGAIIRLLTDKPLRKREMQSMVLPDQKKLITEQLDVLVKDKMVTEVSGTYRLP
jgi:A/G-specific adenine glycosylase